MKPFLFSKSVKSLATFAFMLELILKCSSTEELEQGTDSPSLHLFPETALTADLTTESKWIQSSLERHNYLRSLHNAQQLTHNKTLSEISQGWANYLLARTLTNVRKNGNTLGNNAYFEHNHETNRKYRLGENLFYTTHPQDIKVNSTIGVTLWYNEIVDYDFQFARVKTTSKPDSMIGHFTQLIWNSTTQMGTAYATGRLPRSQLITFVVANYYPPGNVVIRSNFPQRLYLENVKPPVGQAENEIEDIPQMIRDKIKFWDIQAADVTTPEDWIYLALMKHNEYREYHHFPVLEESTELTTVAQSWANQLLQKSLKDFNEKWTVQGQLNFRNFAATEKGQFGENIIYFVHDGREVNPSYVVSLWYNQHQFYDFENKRTNLTISSSARTKDFEQMIWKSTVYMGIAYATGQAENGQMITFVVANYFPKGFPAGVTLEEKHENIPPNNSIRHFVNIILLFILSSTLLTSVLL